jgi:hypothetical protein
MQALSFHFRGMRHFSIREIINSFLFSPAPRSSMNMQRSRFILSLLIVGLNPIINASEFRTDFSDGLGPWQKSPSGTWEVIEDGGNKVAGLTTAGVQPGGVRRPTGSLLLQQFNWTNYSFGLRAKTLEPETTVQRDVVLIFGYVDATHFYYVHVSSDSDDKFHNIIMRVDGETRQTIDQQDQPEPRLTDNWHDIKVQHDANGSIRIFVDDMAAPLMTAQDTTYPAGAVGFGSFDDRALFDDVIISGEATARTPSEITNLSTRGSIPTISDRLVAGVVVGGSTPQQVLIRAAGPSLTDFGVLSSLSDPELRVFRASDGAEIAFNNNWSDATGGAEIASVGQAVGAFEFAEGSLDSAMILTLPPGAYTAQVNGRNGSTGVTLVEVYAVTTAF